MDLHFTGDTVHSTLCVLESLTQEDIRGLIETIDDELLDVLGVSREDFIVHVYQGREMGVYSDEGFGANGNDVEGAHDGPMGD